MRAQITGNYGQYVFVVTVAEQRSQHFPTVVARFSRLCCGFAGVYSKTWETWAQQVYFSYWMSSRSRRGSKDATGQ